MRTTWRTGDGLMIPNNAPTLHLLSEIELINTSERQAITALRSKISAQYLQLDEESKRDEELARARISKAQGEMDFFNKNEATLNVSISLGIPSGNDPDFEAARKLVTEIQDSKRVYLEVLQRSEAARRTVNQIEMDISKKERSQAAHRSHNVRLFLFFTLSLFGFLGPVVFHSSSLGLPIFFAGSVGFTVVILAWLQQRTLNNQTSAKVDQSFSGLQRIKGLEFLGGFVYWAMGIWLFNHFSSLGFIGNSYPLILFRVTGFWWFFALGEVWIISSLYRKFLGK